MSKQNGRPYTLGLDLGVASIGWALVDTSSNAPPYRVIRAGVHLFEAGVDGGKQDAETAMAAGREKSLAMPRRDARQQRRQIWRRAYRKRVVLKRLIKAGLLPPPDKRLGTPLEIDAYLKAVDAALRDKWEAQQNADHRQRQLLPYRLRAAALLERLDPFEVGRAIYHLAQRRGFLSNRKTDKDGSADDKEDSGAVKAGISELHQLMEAAGAATLGEFFASLDPTDPETKRIRGRWTGRSMYEDEFARIWEAQLPHHANLMTEDAKNSIHKAIFFQRPLKSQRHLIGHCSLFSEKRRAPLADRLSQRFRMLQKVNDIEVMLPGTGELRRLTGEEREAAIGLLQLGDASFSKLRRALKLPTGSRFNFEDGGEKKLVGLRTDEKLRVVFGERWDSLTEQEKDAVVEDCLSIERADAMEKRGRQHWGLTSDQPREFARVRLEEGYANLSRAAMRQLIPELEKGVAYATARKKLFPESFVSIDPVEELPAVANAFDDPVSPAVARALTELRGVVNAIIRRYGKPQHIRVELARDLKKGRTRREKIGKQIQARRRVRETAAEQLHEQYPARAFSHDDILKVLLADECGWQCPYTGRSFGWDDLFGPHPTVDIEHIWPFKRSLDNSFINKTLCCVNENRSVKRDKMPAEAYQTDRLATILQRVAAFKGDAARQKLDRFTEESIPSDFTTRHLNETRYISRKAAEYLALLYGGKSDDESKQRVHVTTGALTGWLRREWGMDAILSHRNEKDRSDHRHHAIDAIVVALTTQSTIRKLHEAAARADDSGSHRLFEQIDPPFDPADARRAIEAIVVSHRQRRRAGGLRVQKIEKPDGTVVKVKQRSAQGKLHNDTIYSRPLSGNNGRSQHRIRKELHKLSEKEIEAIIDPRIRETVRTAYEQRKLNGAKTPKQAFSEAQHRPQLPNGDRIRRVRLLPRKPPTVRSIGSGGRQRIVDLQANHHTIIMATLNKDGTEKTWADNPVRLIDALHRVQHRLPLVSQEVPKQHAFKFSLTINDYVEIDAHNGASVRAIYRVNSISKRKIAVTLHSDGRDRNGRTATNDYIERSASWLFNQHARKVHINYLGEVHNAGG